MTLGNGELADADQAVHLAGVLVTEQGGGLAQTHGQIPVASCPVQEHLVLEGAGHGTQGKAFLLLVIGIAQNEHAVQVVIPVAGDPVQIPLRHQGSLGQQIAALAFLVLHPALQGLDDPGALGQQNGQALTDGLHGGEEFQLPAQLVVIPLQGLLLLLQVLVQLVLAGESDAVNSLEHLPLGVAPPVSAAGLGQLEAVVLDAAGVVQVGTGAQVGEVALGIEGNDGILGQVVDQLHLIGLVFGLHIGNGLGPGLLAAL